MIVGKARGGGEAERRRDPGTAPGPPYREGRRFLITLIVFNRLIPTEKPLYEDAASSVESGGAAARPCGAGRYGCGG